MRVGGVSREWRQDHVLAWMTRYGHHELLQHPLVTRWLNYKWQSYVRCGLYIRIGLASVLAVLLTVFTAVSWWVLLCVRFDLSVTGRKSTLPDILCCFA